MFVGCTGDWERNDDKLQFNDTVRSEKKEIHVPRKEIMSPSSQAILPSPPLCYLMSFFTFPLVDLKTRDSGKARDGVALGFAPTGLMQHIHNARSLEDQRP